MNTKTSRFFLKATSSVLCVTMALTANPAGANTLYLLLMPSVMAYPAVTPIPVTTTFGYDGNSNLTARADGNGRNTTYQYDVLNRLAGIDYPGGSSPDVAFAYDAQGNRTSMTDATGTTEYAYDVFDRLVEIDYPSNNFIHYEYDNAGNITSRRYGNWLMAASGHYTYIQYTYDEDNRIASVKNAFTNDTTAYLYDRAGNLTKRTLPNGAYTNYSYDTVGRLTTVDHRKADTSLIVKYTYTLNAIGNRTQVVETLPSGGPNTTVYTYDVMDRLDTVTYPDGRFVNYDYDTWGNRTKMAETIGGTTTTTDYFYDNDSRLLYTKVNNVEDEDFFYDAIGNLIQRVGVSAGNTKQIDYVYDTENRLVRYYDGTNNVEYIYDGAGQRVAKIANGVRTNYLNDPNRKYVQAVMETDTTGVPTAVRVWGNELIDQEDYAGAGEHYYLQDSIGGNVRRMVDSAATVTNSYEYDAFGRPLSKTEGVANDHQFHGEVQDEETALLFLRARYGDTSTGRFLTRDPLSGSLEKPMSSNQYLLLGDDPVNSHDPTGLRNITDVVNEYLFDGKLNWFGEGISGGQKNMEGKIGDWDVKPVNWVDSWARWHDFAYYGAEMSGKGTLQAQIGIDAANACVALGIVGEFILRAAIGGDVVDALFQREYGPSRFDGGRNDGSGGAGGPFVDATASGLWDTWQHDSYGIFLPPGGGGGGGGAAYLPGGVALNKTAEVLLDINKIKGVTYDAATGQLIVYGEQDVSLPAMSIDDLSVAARAAALDATPVVSIDPPPLLPMLCRTDAYNCNQSCDPGTSFSVRYGPIMFSESLGQNVILDLSSKTHFGYVMFEADRVMKCLAMGQDNVTLQPVTSSVPGYMNMVDRWRQMGYSGNSSARFWFQPKAITLVPSPDGKSMVFSDASVELLTESKYLSNGQVFGDPAAEAFAQNFSEHYDEFAVQFPVLEELRQLAKITGIMKWVRENNIPMDLSLIGNHVPAFFDAAAWCTPKTSVTREWDEGNIHHTLTVTGGVTYCKDLTIQGAANGPESAVLAARPSETALAWTASSGGKNYNVAAVSLDKTPKDGGMSRADTDLSARANGAVPLSLTRYYDSFDAAPSMFGWGWDAVPYQLRFKGARSQFNLCAQQWEGYSEVWFAAKGGQGVYKYTPSGMYDKMGDPLGIAGRFDPAKNILVYSFETKNVPGILLSDNTTRMIMRLSSGALLDFDMSGNLTRIEDRNGNLVDYTRDGSGNLTGIAQTASGRSIAFTYSGGRVVSASGPGGHTVAYAYDVNGNLASAQVDAPAGQKIQYEYDSDHNLIKVKNADNAWKASRDFDVYGRAATVQQPGVATPFQQDFSLADRTTATTGPEGFSQSTQFDADYNPTSVTDARSNSSTLAYNTRQDAITSTNADGKVTEHFYSSRGDRLALKHPNGRADMQLVNGMGLPVETFHVAPDAHFENNFDAEHILTASTISGICSVDWTHLEYDAKGNLTKVTDARNNARTFGYDSRGNRVWSKDGRTYQTDYTFDSASRLTHVQDPESHAVDYTYNVKDELTQIATTAGTVDMQYDGKGRLWTVTNGNAGSRHTMTYDYNNDNQITQVTDPAAALTAYGYDARGNLSTVTHAGVPRFSYGYDGLNRLTNITYTGTVNTATGGGWRAAAIPRAPAGGEGITGDTTIRWDTVGDWTGNENLAIYYSTDGTNWTLIATVNRNTGSYVWHTAQPALNSGTMRLKFVRPADPNFRAGQTGLFRVYNGGEYYVNDASRTGDVYCTAAGAAYNGTTVTGLTPGNPVNDVRDILSHYTLLPGAIIRVDTGNYSINSDIVFSAAQGGTTSAPVVLTGPTTGSGAIITHTNPTSLGACVRANGTSYLTIEYLKLTAAQSGIRLDNASYCTVGSNECYGNGMYDTLFTEGRGAGIYLNGGGHHTIERNVCRNNGGNGINGSGAGVNGMPGRGWGIFGESTVSDTIRLNACYANAGIGGASGGGTATSGYSEGMGIFIVTPSGSPTTCTGNLVAENSCYTNAGQGRGSTTGVGGMAYGVGIALMSTVNSVAEKNVVYANNATGGASSISNGGSAYSRGIYCQGETNVTVSKNQSYDHVGQSGTCANGNAGGWMIAQSCGIEFYNSPSSLAVNNLVRDNKAIGQTWLQSGQSVASLAGGVLLNGSAQTRVYNNTATRNYAQFKDNSGMIGGNLFANGSVLGNNFMTVAGQVNVGLNAYALTSTNCEVRNNILWSANSFAAGLSVDSNSLAGFVSNTNLFYVTSSGLTGRWGTNQETTLATWRTRSGQDATSLSGDPKFYNFAALNYHLAYDSPAIDTGQNLAVVTSDIDGESRPADGPDADAIATHDMGYDEYIDSDGDKLSDWIEDNITHTDRSLWDTDGDGMDDGWEVKYTLDPNDPTGVNGPDGNPDGDAYTNIQEYPDYNPRDPNSHPNTPPALTGVFPEGASVLMVEGDTTVFSASATDIDGDPISYTWKLNGVQKSTTTSWTMTTNDESSGTYLVRLDVTAGVHTVSHEWTVTVSNLNRPPHIDPASLPGPGLLWGLGQTITLAPSVSDPDNLNAVTNDDNSLAVTYSGWMTSATKTIVPGDGGIHTVTVTVTDNGLPPLSDSQVVTLNVDDTLPACTVSTTSPSPTMVTPIPFAIVFSESVTGFDQTDIGVVNGSVASFSGNGTTYAITVTPSSSSTTVSVSVAASKAQDLAGNGNTASNTASVVYDNIAPTCIVTGPASPTNNNPIVFTIAFSDPVTGLTAGEVAVTGGSKGALSGNGTTYTIPVTPTGQGSVTCQVPAGAAQKAGGKDNAASNIRDVTYDSLVPTCTVTGPVSPTNASPINFTINFGEPVSGLTAGGITVTNGAKGALTGSGSGQYTLPVTPTAQGSVTCQVPAGAAQDGAGNGSSASNNLSITYDSLTPACTVTGPVSPTNASPVNFTINFGEPVSGLTADGIAVTNGAKGALTGSGAGPYTMPVTPMAQGLVTCQVVAAAAQDAGGNGNTASNNLSITYDSQAPTCTVTGPVSPTNVSPINFTIDFGEPVSGLTAAGIAVTNGAKGALTGSGLGPYILPVTPTGQGPVTCQVIAGAAHDAANNGNSASNNLGITYDTQAPTCAVTGPASPTDANPITFTLTFSDPVSGLTPGAIAVTNGGGVSLSGGPTIYMAEVTPSSDGPVTCRVPAGAAQDAAGNGNAVSNTLSVDYDGTIPSCTITGPASPTGAAPITLTVAFTEVVTGLELSDFTVTNCTPDTLGSSDQKTYTLTVIPISQGEVTCLVPANAARDSATNGCTTSNLYSVVYDSTKPSCTISALRSAFNSSPIIFTIRFDVPVTGLLDSEIAVTGGSRGTLLGSGADYTIEVNVAAEGPVSCRIPEGAAQAVSTGNPNSASNTLSVAYDVTAPAVAVNQAAGQTDPTNASTIDFTASFNEYVAGFDGTDVVISGTAGATTAVVTGTGPYNIAVSGMTGNGTVVASIGAGRCADAAGTGNLASTSTDNTVTYDVTPPTCNVSGPSSPANTAPISFTLTFGKPVHNLNASLISVTGGTSATPVGIGAGPYYTAYTLDVTPSGQVAVTCQVQAGAAEDTATNGNTPSNNLSITYDSQAPSCVVTPPASPTNASPLMFTLMFNEPVSDLLVSEIQLTNGIPGAFDTTDNQVFTLAVTPSGQATVSCQVPAGAAHDAANNANTASNDASAVFDSLLPSCIITGPASPAKTSPLVFTVTFSEPVSGLLASEVNLTNGAPGTLDTTDDRVYTLEVNPSAQGIVTCQVPLSAAQDAAGNGNTVSNTLSVTYDSVAPICTIIAPSGPIHTPPVIFTISFSEAVSDLTVANIATGNGMAGTLTGSGAGPYTLDVTPLAMGNVTCQVQAGAVLDTAGNGNDASSIATVYYDNLNPACWITGPASPTNDAPILFSINFGAPVTDLDIGEIVVTNGTKNSLSGSLMSYSLTVTPAGQGPVTCQVPAGAAKDSAANGNTESNVSLIVYDTLAPTASFALNSPSPTTDNVLTFSVNFNESVGSTLTQGRISPTGTLAGGASVTGLAQAGNDHTVTLTVADTNADGTLGITVGPGVTDLAGNAFAGGGSLLYTLRNWFGFRDQPQGGKKYVGASALLTVALNTHGDSLPAYQWWFDDAGKKAAPAPISGETGPSLTVAPLTLAAAGDYWCVVSYFGAEFHSDSATLEVRDRLTVTADPVGGNKHVGDTHLFTVVATGGYQPLSYQWKKDGNPIPTAPNAPEFTLSHLQESNTGVYTVEITDDNREAMVSGGAELTVKGFGLPLAGVGGLIALASLMTLAGMRIARRR